MTYTTLIQAPELAVHLSDPDWAIIDCRFYLAEPGRGREDYLAGHVPGAVYAHLEEDLCGPILPRITGRHPLPEAAVFTENLSVWGINETVQVIAYDDAGGSMAAARLWWMLRWLGHRAAAVLDGGWKTWKHSECPVKSGAESRPKRTFTARVQPGLRVDSDELLARLGQTDLRLVDVRSADRYRGENETIDPVAGHIPGALNLPYMNNFERDGKFKSPQALRNQFISALDDEQPEQAIFYCGSGVTAAHSLLALTHAGFEFGKLYDGSWSEWITDPGRPVVTGPEPG
jgi:thiosulfate/3-mercaptopyruvate sulfurtransferase